MATKLKDLELPRSGEEAENTEEHGLSSLEAEAQNAPDVAPGSAARPSTGEPFESILERRLSRRTMLKGAAGVAAAAPMFSLASSLLVPSRAEAGILDQLTFEPIAGSNADEIIVPEGYDSSVLLRWGDSLYPGTPDLDVTTLGDPARSELLNDPDAPAKQARRFGYNCDFNGYFPLPRQSNNSNRGLLATNHEFTTDELMIAGWTGEPEVVRQIVTDNPNVVGVLKAAHGVSIVEIRRDVVLNEGRFPRRQWRFVRNSGFNRRITGDTPIDITGPAAGDALLQSKADPSGTRVLGTLNNCAGGVTPWGTLLTCEENFDQYFGNFDALKDAAAGDPVLQKYVDFHARIPLPGGQSRRGWELVDERFDVANEPTEAFRFGWVVEVDPYDPASTPKKRTALGRFKHEGATVAVGPSGQVAVYSGDDARFEYIFKFVPDGTFVPGDREANMELMEGGTLYVARFNDDGTGEWLPLDINDPISGPILAAEFASQAEVLVNARRAGDLLGATPMDRPEDIDPQPGTGKVFVMLTNNSRRDGSDGTIVAQGREVEDEADATNPREDNPNGHVLEITERGADPAATRFDWEIFMLCGNPLDPEGNFLTNVEDLTMLPLGPRDTYFAGFADPAAISPIGSPDNVVFDRRGNMWISTDGQTGDLNLPEPINDGVFAVPTDGPERGFIRQFLSGVRGCEICGPEFTPNQTTFFAGIQHPGEGGTLEDPISDWPDRIPGAPARPSVVSIVKTQGLPFIGTGTGVPRRIRRRFGRR